MLRRRRLFLGLCLLSLVTLGILASLSHAQSDLPAATPLNYGDNLPGTLSYTSPRAVYAFVGAQNDLVTVEVSPLAGSVDPKVTLLDPSGQILMQNDNGAFGGKPDAFLSLFLPESGFYTLIVESANGATGDFLIQLTGRAPVKSHRLEFGVPVEVDVRTDPLPVYFTFKANTDCPTTLTVYDISAGTPYTFPFVVIVRDENGTPVEQLQGGRMTENRMTVHNQPDISPTAGLYEVEVTSADPAVAGSLFLVVTCADQEPACFVSNGGPEGTPTPATPTPPPPTFDPCDLSEITITQPDGSAVIVSGQESAQKAGQGERGGGPIQPVDGSDVTGDRGGGPIQPVSDDTLTPLPTPSAPTSVTATPCPTPPPCLSPMNGLETEAAATKAAILGTFTAGGVSQQDIQATGLAYGATIVARLTQVAGEPNPCAPPEVTPCPTQGIHLPGGTDEAATVTALEAAGCATPVVTPCPNDDRQLRIPSAATEIAETLVAEGCATPVSTPECPPPSRAVLQQPSAATATALAYQLGCNTPTPVQSTPTCPPNVAGAVVPCQPTPTEPCPTPNLRGNFGDARATGVAMDKTAVAEGVSKPELQATNAALIPTLVAYLTQQAQSPCNPTPEATPTCPPLTAAALPCGQMPSPTPGCTPAAATVALPCQPGCPTPGAVGATPSSDLGILAPSTPCVTPTLTPTPTSTPRASIPRTVDCGNFALTSPTDGLPDGGVTVYWNPAPGATAYRVNVFNDANQLKLSLTVAGNVTSVGIDVSEGAIGSGYVFTVQVQALFNGKVGCSSAKTENRAAPPGNNGGGNNGGGNQPKPTCSPLAVTKPNC